jgi:hypothetical protein
MATVAAGYRSASPSTGAERRNRSTPQKRCTGDHVLLTNSGVGRVSGQQSDPKSGSASGPTRSASATRVNEIIKDALAASKSSCENKLICTTPRPRKEGALATPPKTARPPSERAFQGFDVPSVHARQHNFRCKQPSMEAIALMKKELEERDTKAATMSVDEKNKQPCRESQSSADVCTDAQQTFRSLSYVAGKELIASDYQVEQDVTIRTKCITAPTLRPKCGLRLPNTHHDEPKSKCWSSCKQVFSDSSMETLKEQVESYEAIVQVLTSDRETLRQRCAELQAGFDKLQRRCSQSEADLSDCAKQLWGAKAYAQRQHDENQALRTKLDATQEEGKCVICLTESATHAVIPCGHLSVCGACRACVTTSCPVCRQSLTSMVQIYKP